MGRPFIPSFELAPLRRSSSAPVIEKLVDEEAAIVVDSVARSTRVRQSIAHLVQTSLASSLALDLPGPVGGTSLGRAADGVIFESAQIDHHLALFRNATERLEALRADIREGAWMVEHLTSLSSQHLRPDYPATSPSMAERRLSLSISPAEVDQPT